MVEPAEYSFFKSTATTLIKTTAGLLYSPISVIDAFAGNIIAGKRALSAKSVRWQGFVTDSRKIVAGTTWGQVLETRDKSSVKRV